MLAGGVMQTAGCSGPAGGLDSTPAASCKPRDRRALYQPRRASLRVRISGIVHWPCKPPFQTLPLPRAACPEVFALPACSSPR